MIIKVTADGVRIPKYYFNGADEVDLRREGDRLVIVPVVRDDADGQGEASGPAPENSIWGLGSNPITLGVTDASTRLDDYIYGNPHGDEP
jgi:hypothetical protein